MNRYSTKSVEMKHVFTSGRGPKSLSTIYRPIFMVQIILILGGVLARSDNFSLNGIIPGALARTSVSEPQSY